MKIFLDINVVMDYFLVREPHFLPAAEIFTLAKTNQVEVIVDARTIIFTFFHLSKVLQDKAAVKAKLRAVCDDLTIVSLDRGNLIDALEREVPADLEDGAQLEMALSSGANILVSGDKKGFRTKEIKVMSSLVFLKYWTSLN